MYSIIYQSLTIDVVSILEMAFNNANLCDEDTIIKNNGLFHMPLMNNSSVLFADILDLDPNTHTHTHAYWDYHLDHKLNGVSNSTPWIFFIICCVMLSFYQR